MDKNTSAVLPYFSSTLWFCHMEFSALLWFLLWSLLSAFLSCIINTSFSFSGYAKWGVVWNVFPLQTLSDCGGPDHRLSPYIPESQEFWEMLAFHMRTNVRTSSVLLHDPRSHPATPNGQACPSRMRAWTGHHTPGENGQCHQWSSSPPAGCGPPEWIGPALSEPALSRERRMLALCQGHLPDSGHKTLLHTQYLGQKRDYITDYITASNKTHLNDINSR